MPAWNASAYCRAFPARSVKAPKEPGSSCRPSGEEILGSGSPITRHAVLAPFSRFTETVRNFKVSLDIARTTDDGLVTGIISSVPHEGKTTFAANLALLTAQMGHRTLLIDGDMHSPSLTKALCPDAKLGLIDYLQGKASIGDIVRRDVITGLEFVPTVVKERQPNIVSYLTGETMVDFLAAARRQYEYVFIDLPPVVPVVDVKGSAHQFDAFVSSSNGAAPAAMSCATRWSAPNRSASGSSAPS